MENTTTNTITSKETENLIFINGNVPSLKNGKTWTGKYLVSSKNVKAYLKLHGIKSYSSKDKTVEYFKTIDTRTFKLAAENLKSILQDLKPPYKLAFHFVRQTRHRFDFGNAIELLSDLFTAYDVWEDDHMGFFHPSVLYIDGEGYSYDKENAGVYIKVLN